MGWTDRVLLSSSNPGAWNTEKNITMATKTSQSTVLTIDINIGFCKLELKSESVLGQNQPKWLRSFSSALGMRPQPVDATHALNLSAGVSN